MTEDKTIVYMICNDKQIKMTRDVFDYLMTVKHYNKKLKEEIIKLQQEKEEYKECFNLMAKFRDKALERELIYKSRCEGTINLIDRTIEIIKQQPTKDDSWILSRLYGFKYSLNGSDENEN